MNFVNATWHGRARRHALAFLAAMTLALLFHGTARAGMTCSSSSPSPASFNFSTPSGTFTVPRDAPIGTLLTPWTGMQGNATAVWSGCNASANVWYGPAYLAMLEDESNLVSVQGVTYIAYKTSVPGVSLIGRASSYLNGGWSPTQVLRRKGNGWVTLVNWSTSSNTSDVRFGFAMQFAFVKTGVIEGGTTNPPGLAFQVGIEADSGTNPSHIGNVNLSGSATFVVLSCTTPDVTVEMGKYPLKHFTGQGSLTPAKDFNIQLQNCPAGMNSIKYQIDPTTNVVSAIDSIVALDAGSTASGIGLQLLNAAGTAAHPLSTTIVFSGYQGATGGSYTIPLKARYYQTGPSVQGGIANTSMMFTMTYD
ncbi:fimbrial protein [Variovorax ureilyticus]|uniref:Fimbrial protein n=1 Tax=Variovorax ureilyticus TaxID=1836198 RepID=A0ABU8VFN3_9BURK